MAGLASLEVNHSTESALKSQNAFLHEMWELAKQNMTYFESQKI